MRQILSRNAIAAAAALTVMAIVGAAPAAARACADGYVSNISRDATATVARGGRSEAATLLYNLCAGDVVAATRGWLEIALPSGERMRVATGRSATVPTPPTTFEVVASTLQRLASLFTGDRPAQRRKLLATRNAAGVDVPVRGLKSGAAQVVAGERRLALEWVGGVAPFEVEFSSETDGFRAENLQERRFERDMTLAPGLYSLLLIDANGELIDLAFEAVAAAPPTVAAGAGLDKQTTELVTAALLAESDPITWSYEAYLRLNALGASDAAARQLADLLANGGKL